MRREKIRRFSRPIFWAIGALCAISHQGCSRHWFRESADNDANCLIDSREIDPQWEIPNRPVEADPRSRMADPTCPDCSPRPPDDPGAEAWMIDLHGRPLKHYEQIEVVPTIESDEWLDYLPRSTDGLVDISRETAVALALLHSREYQTQVEQVYLTALGLSANRFEFFVQWLGGSDGSYTRGGGLWTNQLGLMRNFAAGGQIAANLLNTFTWAGGGSGTATASSIALTLTQPLLRGAFQHVRLEGLTQAERGLLYQVRDFAHFRRSFYLAITQSYLRLLTQTQAVRNQRANLKNLELNLREHQELFARQMVSQIQVDQVFQQYQSGRIDLFSAEQGLASALDAFKLQLGLPPEIEINLDESLLKAFELTSPHIESLQQESQSVYQELVQFLPPEPASSEKLIELARQYQQLSMKLEEAIPAVEQELEQWNSNLQVGPPPNSSTETKLDWEQQSLLAKQVAAALDDVKNESAEDAEVRDQWPAALQQMPEADRWNWLGKGISQRLREQIDTLFVVQTQARLFLLKIPRFEIGQSSAVELALARRLDLMNQQARVMDAFRKVEVAANSLQSDLNVNASATVPTRADHDNPLEFDLTAIDYSLGMEFDGPLNRFNERNAYRATQIAYQQSRREYMSAKDTLANQIRVDLRNLRVNELNFQVARQQLITAIRQVEEAQFNLRITTEPNSNLTRDLLQALQGLLGAKNNLISSWIEYEVGRIQLFVDLEILQLDENGTWLNETENPGEANGDAIPDSTREPTGPDGSSSPESEQTPASRGTDEPVDQSHPLLGYDDGNLPPIVPASAK